MAKILIVDDETNLTSTLREILEYEEYNVTEANNGLDALNKIKKNKFDVIIMDIKMPKMDGMEALEKCQSLIPDVPVIMISGHATIDTAVQAVKIGAFDFISKPPDLNRLLITVRNAMDKSSLIQEITRIANDPTSNVLRSEINLPKELRLGFQQYILFFEEYVEKAKGEDISFKITKIEEGLSLELNYKSEITAQKVNTWLHEYLSHIKYINDEIKINYETNIALNESKILVAELKNQIRFFQSNLEIAKVKNEFLEDQNSYLRRISLNLSQGNQRFIKDELKRKSQVNVRALKAKFKKGEILEVMNDLLSYEVEHYERDLILLQTDLNHLIKTSGLGKLTYEETRIERNRIQEAILQIINEI